MVHFLTKLLEPNTQAKAVGKFANFMNKKNKISITGILREVTDFVFEEVGIEIPLGDEVSNNKNHRHTSPVVQTLSYD